ncbi:MAG: RHS repeat-associated core domain-containing protein [Thermodesulfovibrionales bacterium]
MKNLLLYDFCKILEIIKFCCALNIAIFILTGITFAAEKVFFYHTDPSGTPLAMTDQNGIVVWRADYKPFGEEQTITGTIENNEKFIGKEKDKETGLYYFGARYMDPKIGRFINPDTIGPVDQRTSKTNYQVLLNPQRLNPYAYALNNPYKYVDQDGMFAVVIHKRITIATLTNKGFSQRAAERVAQGNAYVDRPSNQLSNYQHSMRDTGQSRTAATELSAQFMQTKLVEAANAILAGNYDQGLFSLGEGFHTAQDKKHNWITLLQHGSSEFRTDSEPTMQQEKAGLSNTQAYLSEFWSVLRNDYKLSGAQIEKIRKDLQKY